jgi:hypothetical protein
MEPRRIIKVLANGWEAPYPDEVHYGDMLLLKDYRLNGMPDGPKWDCIEYDAYVEWLQDYLIRCKIDLTEEQCKIQNRIATDNYFTCGFLGGETGFCEGLHVLFPEYNFPEDFEETFDIDHLTGVARDDPYANFLTLGEDEPKPTRLEFILQDYGRLLMMKSDAMQFQQYWPGFVQLEPLHWISGLTEGELEPTDSGWRVYLSIILKRIQDKDVRIKELNRFFDRYSDAIHK